MTLIQSLRRSSILFLLLFLSMALFCFALHYSLSRQRSFLGLGVLIPCTDACFGNVHHHRSCARRRVTFVHFASRFPRTRRIAAFGKEPINSVQHLGRLQRAVTEKTHRSSFAIVILVGENMTSHRIFTWCGILDRRPSNQTAHLRADT